MSQAPDHLQAAYQHIASVADQLLARGLPLIRFDSFDQGRQAAMMFALPTDGQFSERYICKLPVEGLTAEKVEQQYRRFADD